MQRPRLRYRRIVIPTVLAAVLAVETIAVASAMGAGARIDPGADIAAARSAAHAARLPSRIGEGNPNHLPEDFLAAPHLDRIGRAPSAVRPQVTIAQPKAKALVAGAARAGGGSGGSGGSGGTARSAAGYSGRNRMWMPALGIDRAVSFFSCSSNAYPGDRVYRWGCAGSNNVYLFGHAHSVFKPLHDAYVDGRLRKGMQVVYADGNGAIRTYRIAWWKVTTPDNGGFAYAAQSRPSLTLQTCVGKKSQYRLIVRLVQEG